MGVFVLTPGQSGVFHGFFCSFMIVTGDFYMDLCSEIRSVKKKDEAPADFFFFLRSTCGWQEVVGRTL